MYCSPSATNWFGSELTGGPGHTKVEFSTEIKTCFHQLWSQLGSGSADDTVVCSLKKCLNLVLLKLKIMLNFKVISQTRRMSVPDLDKLLKTRALKQISQRRVPSCHVLAVCKDLYEYFVLDCGESYWDNTANHKETREADQKLRREIAGKTEHDCLQISKIHKPNETDCQIS